jgi:hypothetical protein
MHVDVVVCRVYKELTDFVPIEENASKSFQFKAHAI